MADAGVDLLSLAILYLLALTVAVRLGLADPVLGERGDRGGDDDDDDPGRWKRATTGQVADATHLNKRRLGYDGEKVCAALSLFFGLSRSHTYPICGTWWRM